MSTWEGGMGDLTDRELTILRHLQEQGASAKDPAWHTFSLTIADELRIHCQDVPDVTLAKVLLGLGNTLLEGGRNGHSGEYAKITMLILHAAAHLAETEMLS